MFCQVIKSNDKKCHNYSRKNKECCWSHRNLENNEIVVIKPKKEHIIQGTPDTCYFELCKITPLRQIQSKNYNRFCCWKH